MLVYLVRHGQSAGNVPGIQGGANRDLSEIGKAQAEATGNALVGAGIATILASPLTRALRTAQLMATHLNAVIEAWPELAEANRALWKLAKKRRKAHFDGEPGQDVGLTADEVREMFPGVASVGFSGDEAWWNKQRVEGRGKTYRRARKVVKRIRRRWGESDEAVAVIMHGTFGSVLLTTLSEAAPTDYNCFSQHTCGISLVEITGEGTRLRYANRVDHLPGNLRTDPT